MLGRDRNHGLDPERMKLSDALPHALVVHLVNGKDHRHPYPARTIGRLRVGVDQPFASVDQQYDQIGPVERPETLFGHISLQRIIARSEHPSRIDQLKCRPQPLDRLPQDVPRCSRHGCHDRPSRA